MFKKIWSFCSSIKGKLFLFLVMAGIGTKLLVILSLFTLYTNLHNLRSETVQANTEIVYNILETYHKQSQQGYLPVTEAQRRALEAVRQIRYFGDEYFFIIDKNPKMLMHPISPDLEGKDLSSFQDPKGNRLFMDFVSVVKKEGRGHVKYLWPKPGHENPVEKTSYVIGFEQWDWIVGTGLYNDDIWADFMLAVRNIVIFLTILATLFIVPIFLLLRGIIRSTSCISNGIGKLADDLKNGQADLTCSLPIIGNDELTKVSYSYNFFLEKLRDTFFSFQETMTGMTSTSEELSATSNEMSSSMDQQANTIKKISFDIQKISEMNKNLSINMEDVKKNSLNALDAAFNGKKTISQSSEAMQMIEGKITKTNDSVKLLELKSQEVEKILSAISEISFQTNLLALNAAIEAARAGQAGKGFAVVADEVRMLAGRSEKSAKEIAEIISSVQESIKEVSQNINDALTDVEIGSSSSVEADKAFHTVTDSMEKLNEYIEKNTSDILKITKISGSVSCEADGINNSINETSTASHEVASAATNIANLATEIQINMNNYKVN